MASLLNEKTARVEVREDGSLRLGVVADSHSSLHPATTRSLAALSPDAILHAGDIGDLSVLDELRTVAPVYAVRGNIDTQAPDLPDTLTLDVAAHGGVALRILLLHIAVNGPKLRADAARLARAKDASLVVCGHSHVRSSHAIATSPCSIRAPQDRDGFPSPSSSVRST